MGNSEFMNTPARTCVICRIKKPKSELFRFLVGSGSAPQLRSEQVSFDKGQKKLGRGFYICSEVCWDNAVKKKRKIRIGSDVRKATSVSLPEKTFTEVTKQ